MGIGIDDIALSTGEIPSINANKEHIASGMISEAGRIGVGGNPDGKAAFDIQSTTLGVLLPRLDTTARNAIATPPTSLLIFNTTANEYQYNSGTPGAPVWSPVGPAGVGVANDAIWSNLGDIAVGTGANTAAVLGIGTVGQILTVSGGSAVWANAPTSFDIPALPNLTDAGVLAPGDSFGVYNTSAGAHEEAAISQLQTYMQSNLTFTVDTNTLTAVDPIWVAAGDLVQGTGASAAAILSAVATGNTLLSGGVGAASSWGKVGLTTHVSGTLAIGNGGIGITTAPKGSVLVANALDTISALAGVTDGHVLTYASGTDTISWAAPTGAGDTIYTGDDSLAGNRIVTQGTNTLSFTGSVANLFSVDGTTFSVDALNNRVGIGTASPTKTLHVAGPTGEFNLEDTNAAWQPAYYINGNKFLHFTRAGQSAQGGGNIFMGLFAGDAGVTESSNMGIGQSALTSLINGQKNVAIGNNSMQSNASGSSNTAVGFFSGSGNAGDQNTFIGANCGDGNTGAESTMLGSNAGNDTSGGGGSRHTLIGYRSGFQWTAGASFIIGLGHNSAGFTNPAGGFVSSTAIGCDTQISASNQLVLGGGGGASNLYYDDIILGTDLEPAAITQKVMKLRLGRTNMTAGNDMEAHSLALGGGESTGAGGTLTGYISFETTDTGAAAATFNTMSERMRITPDAGFVGIGVTVPLSKLDVTGDGDTIMVPRKSTTGDPAGGTNGQFYYNTFDLKWRAYENGAWADMIGGGSVSPLTTKGDLYTYDTGDQRLAVGSSGQVLTADPGAATGLSYTTQNLSTVLAAGTTTGANNISISSGQTLTFNVGTGGNLNSVATGSSRAWNLPDQSGTIALTTDIPAADGNGIYTGSASLAGNTVVTQAANTLAFTGTAVNMFSVDGTTFSVDGTNNRIGIGTAAPIKTLHVIGDALVNSGELSTSGTSGVKLTVAGTATSDIAFRLTGTVGSGAGRPSALFIDPQPAAGSSGMYAVRAQSHIAIGTENYGVYGSAREATVVNSGVLGEFAGTSNPSSYAAGIDGRAAGSVSATSMAGRFLNTTTAASATIYGVYGQSLSGAASQTRYGGWFKASGGGATTTNIGLYAEAASGTNNYAIIVPASGGTVGLGTSTPVALLDVAGSTTTRSAMRLQSGTAPTSPNDGDIWFDGTNLNIRISGVTRTVNVT